VVCAADIIIAWKNSREVKDQAQSRVNVPNKKMILIAKIAFHNRARLEISSLPTFTSSYDCSNRSMAEMVVRMVTTDILTRNTKKNR
jgi:hypothetical protein